MGMQGSGDADGKPGPEPASGPLARLLGLGAQGAGPAGGGRAGRAVSHKPKHTDYHTESLANAPTADPTPTEVHSPSEPSPRMALV